MDTPFVRMLLCVVAFTLGAGVRAAGQVPDLDAPPPKQKPIVISEEEPGEERSFEVESIERSQAIYPSNFGTPGIFRVRSAESLPKGALTFGIGGEFYWVTGAPLFNGSQTAKTIAESLFVGYSPTDHLTIAVQRRNSSTTFGNPQQLISSLGDFTFSGMYSFPLSQTLALAPLLDIVVASNFNSLAPAGTTLSLGIGAALTYSLYRSTGLPLFLHGNLKYHVPQIRTDKGALLEPEIYFNFSRFHTVTWGLGAEYLIGDTFVPFLELQQQIQTNSSLGFSSHPFKVSVGTRFMPLENKSLAFLLGTDIGIATREAAGVPYTPPYQILGQVSYTFGLDQTERKHYATTADVNVVDRKFIIRKHIEFKLNSSELEPSSFELLDQIADVIHRNRVKKLLIVGHTDSTHTDDYNLKLSQARATSVKRYLVSKGIADEALLTQGYGKRKPIASNASEAGRAKNRRVEFFILE